jgi:glutaconate CoA-transferase subunit B
VPAALEGCLPEEFLAFQISREVRDFERTAVGTLSPVPLLGVLHARARHAAHGKFLFFGSEATPVTDGSKELFDMAQRGKLDLFFLSGAQIDRKGNINLTCIGEYEAPRVRLPGGAGSAMLYYMTRRVVLFTLAHTPRIFVEKCDFITTAGKTPRYPWRRGGPTKLITPLCTMEYENDAGEWRLSTLHPGVDGVSPDAGKGAGHAVPFPDRRGADTYPDPRTPDLLSRLHRRVGAEDRITIRRRESS